MNSSGIDNAREFLALLAKDDNLRDEIHRATDRVLDIAKARGKNFSRKDIAQVIVEDWSEGDNEPFFSIVSEPPGE